MTNKKSVTEKVKLTGTGITGSLTVKIKSHHKEVICLKAPYTGTVTAKLLSDGKKLKVHF